MSEPLLLPVLDTSREAQVDHSGLIATPEEIAEGNRLGREIDIDDDDDNGLSR